MMFFKSIFISFTVWVLTALLNALLMGSVLFFLSDEFKYFPSAFGFTLFFTLIFSMPAVFVLWIVLLANWDEQTLFRSLLKTGFIVSILSSVVAYFLPFGVIKSERPLLSLCIVIAAISSIMMHHSMISSINKNKTTHSHA